MRDTRLFTKGRRGSLPKGCESWLNVPEHLKKILLQLYPEVEILYYKRQWYLYRVIHRGGIKSDDELVKEFQLQTPPGAWLLDHLAYHDSYKWVGDRTSKYLYGLNEYYKDIDKELAKKRVDIAHYAAGYCHNKAKGRMVVDLCHR